MPSRATRARPAPRGPAQQTVTSTPSGAAAGAHPLVLSIAEVERVAAADDGATIVIHLASAGGGTMVLVLPTAAAETLADHVRASLEQATEERELWARLKLGGRPA